VRVIVRDVECLYLSMASIEHEPITGVWESGESFCVKSTKIWQFSHLAFVIFLKLWYLKNQMT